MPETKSLSDLLEPEAVKGLGIEREVVFLGSIAVSLKRIADTMDGTVAGICVTDTIFGGRRDV